MVDEEGGCVHVKIYQPFTKGGKPSVTGVEFSKSFDDPLIPFWTLTDAHNNNSLSYLITDTSYLYRGTVEILSLLNIKLHNQTLQCPCVYWKMSNSLHKWFELK